MTALRRVAFFPIAIAIFASAPVVRPSQSVIHTLESVPARATPSGPPMWEFVRGRQRIVVVGTVGYLPRSLKFDWALIDRKIPHAEAVVSPPGLVVGDNIGIFRGLSLWSDIRKNKFNSGGRTLREVLPPSTYARWVEARHSHVGRGSSNERLRPMYAAMELFESATARSRLARDSPIASLVGDVARRQGLAVVDARFHMNISDPRTAAKRFDVPALDDIACLQQTIEHVGPFLTEAQEIGEAWSGGDMEALETWANRSPMRFCWSTLTNQAIARQQGIDDLQRSINEAWLHAILKAAGTANVVLTTLPIRDLLGTNGLSSALQQAGFTMTLLS